MTDLDTLRPEVLKVLKRTDVTVEMFDTLVTLNRDEYDLIRAELLHLQREEDRLHKVACKQLRRAQKAEAELAAIKQREQDAKDAERYRWLRNSGECVLSWSAMNTMLQMMRDRSMTWMKK